jgi:transposase
MMGIKERRFDLLSREISLEDLVPEDNFYRRLEATLDLSFVRDLVRPLYARGGRPSVDPVVFFRLQLVLFFEGLRSERELMRVAADRLSVRWYLGYDLHEPLPDHSNLTRTRERLGLSVFRRFFERIVEECVEAGLVRGDELFFDSTKVEGDAAVDSLVPRWAVEAHLGELFEEEAPGASSEKIAEETSSAPTTLPTAEDPELQEKNALERDWISRDGAQDRAFKSGPRERTSDTRASTTDPDATPMTWFKGGRSLGYQVHYVVDGGKARIVVGILVTPSEVTENRPMLDLLWRAVFRWRMRPHHVTGDGKYGTSENVAALERSGVRAYVAPHESGSKPGFFAKGEFRYDPDKDAYVCPAGELLRRAGRSGRGVKYRARASVCNACTLKAKCTTNSQGRSVNRYPGDEYLEKVRAYAETEPYRKALEKRKVWVEPLFAEAKMWHGLCRFRLRTLRRVNAEALLIAAGQNLKRLLAFGHRRPKEPAQVAALGLPATPNRGLRHLRQHRAGGFGAPQRSFCNTLELF